MIVSLETYGAATYEGCERRGMHDPVPSIVEVLMKTSAELGEAFEAWVHRSRDGLEWYGEDGKPEGVMAELSDVVLFCAYLGHRLVTEHGVKTNLDEMVLKKHLYNGTRPPTEKRL